jgi:hypothetical protein
LRASEGLDGEGGANNALGSARLRFVGTVTLLVLNRRLSEHVKRVSIARVERGEKFFHSQFLAGCSETPYYQHQLLVDV